MGDSVVVYDRVDYVGRGVYSTSCMRRSRMTTDPRIPPRPGGLFQESFFLLWGSWFGVFLVQGLKEGCGQNLQAMGCMQHVYVQSTR